MTPLHWWAVGGAALGVALPIVIHLLTRPRGERRALPTFRFLRSSANFNTRRSRLRAILVLTTRALALALLALGFARLARRATTHAESGSIVLKRKVIVLDCSLSMRAVTGQTAAFDAARLMAQQVLAEGDTGAADLILAAHTPRAVFGQTSSNLIALKDEAAKARALPEALDINAAIDLAARSFAGLAEADLKTCELIVISDVQRSNWTKAGFAKVPKLVPVRVLKVRGSDGLNNIAIVSAGINGLAEAGAPIAAFAEVANFGAMPAEVDLELNFDGRSWSRHVSLPAGARSSVPLELADVAAGWRYGQFKLNLPATYSDALAEDNRYPLCVKVREARRVALVTAERAHEKGGPAYFLERGLSASADATVQVARFLPAQLEGEVDEALQRSDLLAVVNAGQLSDGQISTLARLLSGGMPVLYVSQNAIDADNIKALQSTLGAALRLPVQFTANKASAKSSALSNLLGTKGSDRDETNGRFLIWVDTQRRPFKIFGDNVTRFTQSMRLTGALASGGAPETGLDAQSILARYADGSAALLLAHAAGGKLAILNMSVGGDERHVGAQPLFVPLIQELSQELLENGAESGGGEAVASGGPALVSFKPNAPKKTADAAVSPTAKADGAYRLLRAEGGAVEDKSDEAPIFKADATAASLAWGHAGDPGVYLIENQGATLAAFAVVPPARDESDLAVLDEDVLKNRLAQERTLTVVGSKEMDQAAEQAKETYGYFFIAALAFLFLELGLLKAFKT